MLYPIGIQNFEDIRKGNYVYVDKTHLIYKLVSSGKYYFLSRPRRFGKSLLTSTMEAYFSGRKDLFDGLEIASLEKDWTRYPVLHVDFSGIRYSDRSGLDTALEQHLGNWEKEYGITPYLTDFGARFKDVIDAAYAKTGRQVVILIDEYDKPIVDNIGNKELMDYNQSTLQGFYGVMKAKDSCIRFGFLTGVSKIGRALAFCNSVDISLNNAYSGICGITETELKKYFGEDVKEMASAIGLTEKECCSKLNEIYGGYHFGENASDVYNPNNLLITLKNKDFGNRGLKTDNSDEFLNLATSFDLDISALYNNIEVSSYTVNGLTDYTRDLVSLLFQTGILTIKGYDKEYRLYTLGFTNIEAKDSLGKLIA